jgi:glutamate racemase
MQMARPPVILVFDSGFGGLTVLKEVRAARPDAAFVYVADDAAFPYGRLAEAALVERVLAVFERLVADFEPDLAVIACNTASTLVMAPLRARFAIPFVGTVPAIKPAAAASRSGLVSVLATPGTVARDYTRGLVAEFAGACRVTLVGAPRLAAIAEAKLRGEPVDRAALAADIAPAFVAEGQGARTDHIVLACTHYPLLAGEIAAAAPWEVALVDPAPAIARRVVQLAGAPAGPARSGGGAAVFTGRVPDNAGVRDVLAGFGVGGLYGLSMPYAG